MLKVKKLKNGLSVIIKPIKGTKAVTFLAMVPVGSRYESEKISGASHFVEHLMFKGTKKRPTALDISRELDAAGTQFNAFTSKEYTGYYIKIASNKSSLALDILADILFFSKFDAEEVKREKGVIVEEIKMYEDNPATAVSLIFEKLLFGNHPLGRDIAGTKKTVNAVSRDDLFSFYKGAYRPDNMVLVAAGNIQNDLLVKINKYFGVDYSKKTVYKKIYKKDFSKFTNQLIPSKRSVLSRRRVDQANVIVGFPGISYNDKKRWALAVLLNILGGGMSSRLFIEVRERRGLAYKIRMGQEMFRDSGLIWIEAGLDQKRLKEAIEVIKDELKKITRQAVSLKELNDAKTNLTGQYALRMEDSSAQASFYALKFWFQNNLDDYEKDLVKIKKVTARQVQDLAKEIFKENKMKVAVIGSLDRKQLSNLLK